MRLVMLLLLLSPLSGLAADPAAFLRDEGREPIGWVAAKLDRHPVVILGEGHWTRHDVDLVIALLPELRKRRAALAVEMFEASHQETIDAVITAEEWDEPGAMAVLRSAAWPYEDYLAILETAWRINREPGDDLRIIGLGPGLDFRETLPPGSTYDSFMADRMIETLRSGAKGVVAYVGLHHAFTRYHQPELSLDGRALRFMDRMGNILRRRLGERVYLAALHKPLWCGAEEPWGYCLPADCAIDCAAAELGRPVAFDLAGSPFASLPVSTNSYYGRGYPDLRLIDFADGWIWIGPPESFQLSPIIPLDRFAPNEEAMEEVRQRSPFAGEPQTTDQLRDSWASERARRTRGLEARGWSHLAEWKRGCR